MPALTRKAVQSLLLQALREDHARQDITSRALLPPNMRIRARIVAKQPGVMAGGPVAAWAFQTLDPTIRCVLKAREGVPVARGQTLLTLDGRVRAIFAAERVALNLLGRLSGIATLTRAFVRRARPTKVLDTRKTLPGLRLLEKYAVRTGGGRNHRMDLSDAILIKRNQLRALREASLVKRDALLPLAIAVAKRAAPRQCIEIEVANLVELRAALAARPHAILLDNWRVADLRRAVKLRNTLHASRFTALEASGGVTLANVRAIARTGVDRVSVGRLTHSAPALDVSLEVVQ